jgi:hypothetical protein
MTTMTTKTFKVAGYQLGKSTMTRVIIKTWGRENVKRMAWQLHNIIEVKSIEEVAE